MLLGLPILLNMQIDSLILTVLFIEKNLPNNLVFNEHGVLTRGYRWVVYDNKGKLEFEVACRNGVWGGSCDAIGGSWGFGGPINNSSFRYNTLADCVTHLWESFCSHSNAASAPWFKKVKSEYERFMNMKPEHQLQLFKEVNFYGEE